MPDITSGSNEYCFLFGGFGFLDGLPEVIQAALKQNLPPDQNAQFLSAESLDELVRMVENHRIGMIFMALNNVRNSAGVDGQGRVIQNCQLIHDLKKKYGLPVVAFSGWSENPQFSEYQRASHVDFYFDLPFEYPTLEKTVKLCMQKIHERRNTISLVLDMKLDEAVKDVFQNLGFKVFWSGAGEEQLERMIEFESVDIALNYQYGPEDFCLRDMIWRKNKNIPVFVTLNYNRQLPPHYFSQGLAGYIDWSDGDNVLNEMRRKFYVVLSPEKREVLKRLPIFSGEA